MGGIEDDEARQFARRGGGDHLAPEALLDQQRQAPAMIEMGMGEEQEIDRCRIEAERLGILLFELPGALPKSAIDQNTPTTTFHHMTRAGDLAIRTVKGQSHPRPRRDGMLWVDAPTGEQRLADRLVPVENILPDLLRRFGKPEELAVLWIDRALFDQKVDIEDAPPIRFANENDRDGADLSRLHESQDLEQLVHRAVAAGKCHQRPRAHQEMQFAHGEIV